MIPTRPTMINAAALAFWVLAGVVEAKSKKKTKGGGGDGGSDPCYDNQGNEVPCPISTTVWIIIGVVGGLVLLALVLACVFRNKIKKLVGFGKNKEKKATKKGHQKVPSSDAANALLPTHYQNGGTPDAKFAPYDPYQQPQYGHADAYGGMVEEKYPQQPYTAQGPVGYSVPYDPAPPPPQGHAHYASISSASYAPPPPVQYAPPPQDYSYQQPLYTAPPGTYAPPAFHGHQ